MRMVTGYLPPTGGSVTVGGANVATDEIAAKSKIGYLPENAPLYSDMTVEAFLKFCAEMRNVKSRDVKAAVDKAIDTCFLDKVRHQSVETLSKGFRHRTCFAQSIIHDPEVLILDEPTDGLDPNQKHEVRNLIKRMGEEKAIIFSTHILEEVEASCSRAIIIDRGAIIADGTPDQLKGRAKNAGAVFLRMRGMAGSGVEAELKKLSEVKSVDVIDSNEDGLEARVFASKGKRHELSGAIQDFASKKHLAIHELRTEEGRLDDLFREITKSDTDD